MGKTGAIAIAVFALACAVVSSCGASVSGSDETHFMRCAAQAQCDRSAPGTECRGGLCQPRSPIEDGSSGPTPPTSALPETGPLCDPGCAAVTGLPLDKARGCFDRAAAEHVICYCAQSFAVASCHRRNADGSFWMFTAGAVDDTDEWDPCAAEDVPLTSQHACSEFDHCDVPIPSICDYEATRATGYCGFRVGTDEQCCLRPACTSDDDCPSDKRCTMRCEHPTVCAPDPEGVCQCSTPGLFDRCEHVRLCISTEESGPRGDTLDFTIIERQEPCPSSGPCEIHHVITPDGTITIGNETTFGRTETVEDPGELLWEIDYLRVALAGGPLACDGPVQSPFIRFELRTDEDTYVRDVTHCFTAPSPLGEMYLPLIWSLKAR